MEHLHLPETPEEKSWFKILIVFDIVFTIFILIITRLVFSFPEKCFLIDIMYRTILIFLIIGLFCYWYYVRYVVEKKYLNFGMIVLFITVLLVLIPFSIPLYDYIKDCNIISDEELIKNYVTCEYWIMNETEHGFNSKLVEIRVNNTYKNPFDTPRIDITFPLQIDNITIEYNKTYLIYSNRYADILSKYKNYTNAYGVVFSKIISNDIINVTFLTIWNTNISKDIKNKLRPESIEITIAGKTIKGLKIDGPFWWPPPKLGGPE